MAEPTTGRATVLVADDEPEQLKIVSYALSRSFKVITARNMEEAIRQGQASQPEVVLCDYRMPGPDGIKTLIALRDLCPKSARFLVTAHGDMDILREVINSNAVYRFLSKPLQVNLLVTDIQRALEYMATRQELENAERLALAGTLASMAVHDMRNALQGISMVPALVAQMTGPDIELVRSLVTSSYGIMENCVKEILTVSRGHIPEHEKATGSLLALAEELTGQFVAMYSTHRFVCAADDSGPYLVQMASTAIRRVLSNLLINALQASPPGATVRVNIGRPQGAMVHLCVEDQGAGVPPEHRDKIFQGLFTTKGAQGTGLGLKQCRQIMRAHGGDLVLDTAFAPGARFVGTLPAA